MDRGALQAMVHSAAKNQTQLKQLSPCIHTHTHTHVLDSSPCFTDEETEAREVNLDSYIQYFINVLPG